MGNWEVVVFDEELKHYGVVGMKWGVRRGRGGTVSKKLVLSKSERRERTGKTTRAGSVGLAFGLFTTPVGGLIAWGVSKHLAEKDYMADKKDANSLIKRSKREIKNETKALNADPKYKGKNLNKDKALQKEYFKEYASRADAVLKKNAKSSMAGKEVSFKYDPDTDAFPYLAVKRKDR